MFTLTSIQPTLACFGTSYSTLEKAKEYAFMLKINYGLCTEFVIGKYENGKHIEVFDSRLYSSMAEH